MSKCQFEALLEVPVRDCTDTLWKETDDLQTQIYILSAVFGGVCGFLLLFTFGLLFSVMRLSKKMSRLGSTEILQRHGYEAYSGKPVSPVVPTTPVAADPFPQAKLASPPPHANGRFSRKADRNGFY